LEILCQEGWSGLEMNFVCVCVGGELQNGNLELGIGWQVNINQEFQVSNDWFIFFWEFYLLLEILYEFGNL
jgi:hypothetical protein